jgi:hypothetical protein
MLSQSLRITAEEEEFSTLEGESEKPITDLSRSPNSFWLHPNLFLAVAGPQSIRAAEMAILVLLVIKEENSEEDGLPTKDEIGIYNFLVFLWAVEKRWTQQVTVQDPPLLARDL